MIPENYACFGTHQRRNSQQHRLEIKETYMTRLRYALAHSIGLWVEAYLNAKSSRLLLVSQAPHRHRNDAVIYDAVILSARQGRIEICH